MADLGANLAMIASTKGHIESHLINLDLFLEQFDKNELENMIFGPEKSTKQKHVKKW